MTDHSRSTCFPHCVTSCFGIRKRQLQNGEQIKIEENDKLCKVQGEKYVAMENGDDSIIDSSKSQSEGNGSVFRSKSDNVPNSNQTSSAILAQPEKSQPEVSSLPNTEISDSNGQAKHDSNSVIPCETCDATGDCHELNNTPKDTQSANLTTSNHTFTVNITEQSPKRDRQTELTDQRSVDNYPGEVLSIPGAKQTLCKSGAYQSKIEPSDDNMCYENGKKDDAEKANCVLSEEDDKCHTHFRELVDKEKTRLTQLVSEWSILLSTDISVEVQDEIRSVTGQTNLIITERFAQFSHLISSAEGNCQDKQSDGKTIMASDLQGFWDMILFQVKDVLDKFERLDKLRKNNWDLKYLHAGIASQKTPKKKGASKDTSNAKNDKEKERRLAARKRLAEARQRMKEQTLQTPNHGALML